MKLGLGTAQFGMDYGVSNTHGETPANHVNEILRYANTAGITYLDTAPVYGSAEKVIGQALLRHVADSKFNIVTKLQKLTSGSLSDIRKIFLKSLLNLGVESIYGLLVHDAKDLLSVDNQKLYDLICELKQAGYVEKIGISVYSPEELNAVLEHFKLDLIQCPLNVFDQRFLRHGLLLHLKQQGVEIQVRSVFLQGLLLMDLKNIPTNLASHLRFLEKYSRFLETNGLSPLDAALGFIQSIPEIDVAIVGVNNLTQLQAITAVNQQFDKTDFQIFANQELGLIDPRRWVI